MTTAQQCRQQLHQQQGNITETFADAFANIADPPLQGLSPPVQPEDQQQPTIFVVHGDAQAPQQQHPTTPAAIQAGQRQPRHAPRRVCTNCEKYLPALLHFMSWKDHVTYPRGHEFSQQDIQGITADEIVCWAKWHVYGSAEANDGVEPPVFYRHNYALNWKKQISYFMPNNHLPWNDDMQTGNPTRSQQMKKLLANIKRMQVQHRGAASRVRRPFTPQEYKQMMELCSKLEQKGLVLCCAAYFSFQLAMISRLDDAAKFRLPVT